MEKNKKNSNSKSKKFYMILGILLILLIPIAFLTGIVKGRQSYRNEAVSAVSKSWADKQILREPTLTINQKKLPLNDYNVNIKVNTELRKKGIFKVPVYTADVVIKGNFQNSFGKLNDTKAILNFDVTDSKGFIEQPKFKLLNGNLTTSNNLNFHKLISCSDQFIPFEIQYKIRGINELYLRPNGQNNIIHIEGNWENPSFDGDFLPTDRKIEKNKFQADWSIPAIANSSIEYSKLGVSFLMPVDNYRMSERSVKYSFLFLALTFLSYFIYEITSKQKKSIHQLQYLMIGISMLIFYLLLVSLSEFIPFAGAYITASIMTIGLISIYTYFVITKKTNLKFSLLILSILSLLYIFLYILLMLQDLS
ncbi:MAG: cell envelope integrity protein CreD, partial [Candidatus Gastranaerophilales bacterium]|nr:cell envelope integrity protein CreD [Candidatus Gastranaerophilales bacterium]